MSLPVTVLLAAALLVEAAPIPKDAPPSVVLGDTQPGKDEKANVHYLQRQAKLFKSKPVLKAALLKPDVARVLPLGYEGEPVEWLEKRLQVEVQPEEHTIRVWLREGGTRREQAALLNTLVEIYLKEERSDRLGAYGWHMEQSMSHFEDVLQERKKRLEERRVTHFSTPPAARDPRDEKELRELQQEIEGWMEELEQWRIKLRAPSRITLLKKAEAQ